LNQDDIVSASSRDGRVFKTRARSTSFRWQKAAAVLIGICAALAIGEVVLRFVGAPEVAPIQRGRFQLSTNPRLAFEPVPKIHIDRISDKFYDYPGTSNSLGFRDREHTLEKPRGTYRIAVLGDSIAAGYGVERTEDVFPARLETNLHRAGLPVEVLNFAVSGYNTEQEVETLRTRALAFAPDLVVVAYCHNDTRPPDPRIIAALHEVRGNRRLPRQSALDRALVHSALYRFLRYAVLDPSPRDGAKDAAGQKGDTVPPSLHELGEIARSEHFEVLLAVFPFLPQPYERGHGQQHNRLAAIAQREGFHHLDLRPAFRDCGPRLDELRFDRYHPTTAGHACAAAALTNAVAEIVRRDAEPLRTAG
jgi:lysophospholipase L1-like esterase